MVLIVPTSGCINVDLKNIARQMINIEQNNKLFDTNLAESNCKCISTNSQVKHKSTTELSRNEVFSYNRNSTDPFNVYTIPNPLDPEYPIEIETVSNVGTVAIYLNSRVIGEHLKRVIVKSLEVECTKAIMQLFSEDEDIHTNGIVCIYKDGYSTSQYTLVSKPTDLYTSREIYYCGLEKKKRTYSPSHDGFIWNIYVIYSDSYSLHDMLTYTGYGYNDLAIGSSLNDSSFGSKREAMEYSKLICVNLKDTVSSLRKKQIEQLKYLDNYLLEISLNASNKLPEKMYAPNMILLDAAQLFDTKIVIRQLEYPTIWQYNIPRFINVNIPIKKGFGYDILVMQEYIRDNKLEPLFHVINDMPQSLSKDELKKAMNELIWHTSWYCLNKLEQMIAGACTWNMIPKRDRKKLAEIRHIYFMRSNGICDILKDADIHGNLQWNLENLISLYTAKLDESPYLNLPIDICYITGVPLWDYYFEFQFICSIKISAKITHDVLIPIKISKLGIVFLTNAARNANDYLNRAKFGYMNFSAGNIIGFFEALFNANKIKITQHNVILRKAQCMRIDIIHKLNNPLVRKLLTTVDRFGSVYTHKNLYAVNPDTNEIFVGIHDIDYTDAFLLNMKKNSNAYIFRIC